MTNTTPEAKPTPILNKFGRDQVVSKRISPIKDTGILFREPTRLNVVGVVVDKNHNTENEIPNATNAERNATIKNAGFVKSG